MKCQSSSVSRCRSPPRPKVLHMPWLLHHFLQSAQGERKLNRSILTNAWPGRGCGCPFPSINWPSNLYSGYRLLPRLDRCKFLSQQQQRQLSHQAGPTQGIVTTEGSALIESIQLLFSSPMAPFLTFILRHTGLVGVFISQRSPVTDGTKRHLCTPPPPLSIWAHGT